jgi:hypothetical protein
MSIPVSRPCTHPGCTLNHAEEIAALAVWCRRSPSQTHSGNPCSFCGFSLPPDWENLSFEDQLDYLLEL